MVELSYVAAMSVSRERPGLRVSTLDDVTLYKINTIGSADEARSVLPNMGRVSEVGEWTAMAVAPGEWMMLHGAANGSVASDLEAMAADATAQIVEITQGRVIFELAGADVAQVLNTHCPLDLRDRSFGPGSVARSLFGDAGAMIARLDDRWLLAVNQALAHYVWGLVEQTGFEDRV